MSNSSAIVAQLLKRSNTSSNHVQRKRGHYTAVPRLSELAWEKGYIIGFALEPAVPPRYVDTLAWLAGWLQGHGDRTGNHSLTIE